MREDLKKGVYVENLSEEPASSSEEAINLLIKGNYYFIQIVITHTLSNLTGASSRHVGATKMNADSSRSHSVFSLNF